LVLINFYIDGYRFSDEFLLIPNLSEPVVIGAATLQKWRLKLNFETDEVIIDPRVTRLRLLFLSKVVSFIVFLIIWYKFLSLDGRSLSTSWRGLG
jgi:hypothetical protein